MKSTLPLIGKVAFTGFFAFQAIVLIADESDSDLVSTADITTSDVAPENVPIVASPETLQAISGAVGDLELQYDNGEIECLDLLAQIDAFVDQLSYELADLQDKPEWTETLNRLIALRDRLPCTEAEGCCGEEEILVGEEILPAPLAGGFAPGMMGGGYGGGGGAGSGLGLLPLAGLAGLAGLSDSGDNPSVVIVSQ